MKTKQNGFDGLVLVWHEIRRVSFYRLFKQESYELLKGIRKSLRARSIRNET